MSNKSKQDFKRITHLSATRMVPIGTFSVKDIEQPVYESLANLEKKLDEYYKDKMVQYKDLKRNFGVELHRMLSSIQ